MTKDFKNLCSLEAIVLQDDDLLMIKGGQSESITCGVACGKGCGGNCGEGCSGCTVQKPIQGSSTTIRV